MKKFKPRVYSVEFASRGRFVSLMLGIANNVNARQLFYERFRTIRRYFRTARFRSELVSFP